MAPSEESILANFLLSPSSFPTAISLEKFTKLFPRRLQSHPHIRTLYRDLQQLRAEDIDLVQENIYREVKKGEKQKEELRNAQTATGITGMSDSDKMEIDMDVKLFGQPSGQTARPEDLHTLESLLPEIERACLTMEKSIESMDKEASNIRAQLTSTVEGLSDLRYGKFDTTANVDNSVADEVIKGLKNLEDSCNRTSTSG